MIKVISRTPEIQARLQNNEQIIVDDKKAFEALLILNKELEEDRREFKTKNKKSQISAANCILNS